MDILKRVRRNLGAEVESPSDARAMEPETAAGTTSGQSAASDVPRPPEAGAEKSEATAQGDRFVGYIDHIDRSVITGWCYDKEHLERSLPVEVVASNGKRLAAIAGIFRKDVKDAGYGTGQYGFEIDVASLGLKNETLTVRFAEGKVAINKVPFSLDPQRALLEGKLPTSYTNAMQVLALEARARHADLEERDSVRRGGRSGAAV